MIGLKDMSDTTWVISIFNNIRPKMLVIIRVALAIFLIRCFAVANIGHLSSMGKHECPQIMQKSCETNTLMKNFLRRLDTVVKKFLLGDCSIQPLQYFMSVKHHPNRVTVARMFRSWKRIESESQLFYPTQALIKWRVNNFPF